MLKANGPKKWIFDEYCNLSEMQFRFKDKDTALALGILSLVLVENFRYSHCIYDSFWCGAFNAIVSIA